jgi:dihydrofolate synthase/folylpolyglutamate synthase
MTYEEAVAYLESFVNYERHPQPAAMRAVRLDRMRALCRQLGDPQRGFRAVLVAGTNGKGSICALLYSMLRETTLRAGLYTSPHVEHLRERVRAWSGGPGAARTHGDDWISEPEFADAVAEVRAAVEALRAPSAGEVPTYFEALTAAAFCHFRRRGVEVAVLEVGLGGRLDATNVVEPAVTVFGPIGLDHTDVLGDDPVLIAREKAGIIKPHQSVLSVPQSEIVEEVLRATCEAQGAPCYLAGRDVTARLHAADLDGIELTITGLRGVYEGLDVPLAGRHQAQNAAVAVGALESLSSAGVPHQIVARGLAAVDWPGRLEIVHDSPLVLMDGAHNLQAVEALGETVAEHCAGRRIHLLIGLSADKWNEAVGRRLGVLAVSATCTKSRHPRAMDPVQLARRLAPFCPDVHVMSDPADAYTYLLNAVSAGDVIVVTGSLFLVGELRAALRRSHVRPRRAAAPA